MEITRRHVDIILSPKDMFLLLCQNEAFPASGCGISALIAQIKASTFQAEPVSADMLAMGSFFKTVYSSEV